MLPLYTAQTPRIRLKRAACRNCTGVCCSPLWSIFAQRSIRYTFGVGRKVNFSGESASVVAFCRSGLQVADPVSFACGPQLACKSIREAITSVTRPLYSPRLYLTRARVTSCTHSGRLTACCEQIVAAIKILDSSLCMHGCTTLPGATQGEYWDSDVPGVIWAPRRRRRARYREAHKAGSAAGNPRGKG
jgi:hypothetical protein